MSIEQAIISQARPHMIRARVQAVIQEEASKGCRAAIQTHPVDLEPYFYPISGPRDVSAVHEDTENILEYRPQANDLVRLQIWLSPEEEFNWLNSELFLKHLSCVSHRLGFEIIGNSQKILLLFLAHRHDLPIIQTAFRAQFQRCELTAGLDHSFPELNPDSWKDVVFLDCFPSPPYSHLLTGPNELQISTYSSLIMALTAIPSPAVGFYQALFQPVSPDHNWHRNIQILLDLEYTVKLLNSIQGLQKYPQQAPSGDLRHMAFEVETKAHSDKAIYSVAIRLGVANTGKNGLDHIKALSTFPNLFQHGGRPLNFITQKEYEDILSNEKIMEMFAIGATYRSGFLANTAELSGLVHIPPAGILEFQQPPINILETLPAQNTEIHTGTPIGTCDYAGDEKSVCIPFDLRSRSTHIIAKPGQAKSTTMARMILDDINRGMGVSVIDPHGDLVEDLLCLIKEEHIERTIYFNPGDPDYVPLWNPMRKTTKGLDLSRTADDLVGAIKSVVTGWGDRLEHLLRHGFYALLNLPNSTFFDLSDLLRGETKENETLLKKILEVIDNPTARQFWKNEFGRYTNEALGPPRHKLSKLLLSGTVSLMLSQPESFIDFRRIMDDGMIFLANLSTIGSEVREILGCFILSLFHLTALTRSSIEIKKRKQFHIYVDESHRFLTEALEDLIAEVRKYKVSLTLAHHYLSQFGTKKVDALSSVGSTIIMSVDGKDARYLSKDLRNLVEAKDLVSLEIGEAIARIGTDVVRVKLPGPLIKPKRHFKDAIIEHSFRHYYKPVGIIRDLIDKRNRRWDQPFAPLAMEATGEFEEFVYDEF